MTFSSLEEANRYVETFCEADGLRHEQCYKMRLVIEELISNIFKYTEAKTFVLRLSGLKNIEIDIEYLAEEFDLVIAPPYEKPIKEREEGGLGLFLVASMTKTFNYKHQDGKNIYKLTL